jgi:hypothetical protein
MGPSKDEIDGRISETREHADENLGVPEQQAEWNGARYGKIAAVVVGAAAVAIVGVLIYRRMKRPSRREQLGRMLVEALEDLPDMLRELPDEIVGRIKKPLPSIKVVVSPEAGAKARGAFESVVRRVSPAAVGTASNAFIGRFRRSSDPAETDPAYD